MPRRAPNSGVIPNGTAHHARDSVANERCKADRSDRGARAQIPDQGVGPRLNSGYRRRFVTLAMIRVTLRRRTDQLIPCKPNFRNRFSVSFPGARVGPICTLALSDESNDVTMINRGSAHKAKQIDRAPSAIIGGLGEVKVTLVRHEFVHAPIKSGQKVDMQSILCLIERN
jgi:hypothetical protein